LIGCGWDINLIQLTGIDGVPIMYPEQACWTGRVFNKRRISTMQISANLCGITSGLPMLFIGLAEWLVVSSVVPPVVLPVVAPES
jgi:hypothetical protein